MAKLKVAFLSLLKMIVGIFLLMLGSLLHFWITIPQTAISAEAFLEENVKSHPADILMAPYGSGILWAVLMGVVLCIIFNGKNFSLKRTRQIPQIAKQYWHKLGIQAAVIIVIFLILVGFVRTDRLSTAIANHAISADDVYFRLSGTGMLRDASGEAGQRLYAVIAYFRAHVMLDDAFLINLLLIFLVYESMRILFDTKLVLKSEQQK